LRIGVLGPIAWRVPPRHYGGWESVAHLLAEGLARRGHDTTLFATADSITSAKLSSVASRPLEEDRSLPSRVYETLHTAAAFEQAHNLDVLHNNAGVFATALSRLVETPVLTTLHGSAAEADSRLVYSRYREQPYVSITDAERALAPELNYVATVYNGIEVPAEPPDGDHDDYLLVVGRLSPDKGVHHAVELAQLTGRRLVIAGIVPDANREYYETRIVPHVDGRRIEYIGPCDAEQRDELMRRAYAYLHLITYAEAFGLTIVEAMAVGAPVIVFPLGSARELVRDGETGFIVGSVQEAAEALERIPSLDRRRCWSWTKEQFSADSMVEGYIRVYERLAAR